MRNSRIIPIALVLIIVAIAIAALVSLARIVFSGGQTSSQTNASETALLSTSVGHSVMMTVRGPIVADENFRSYSIVVTPDSRTLTTYQGYEDNPLTQVPLGNSVPAYAQFVYALDKADFVQGTALTGSANDLRGVCATGDVYEFSVLNQGTAVKMLWTSTCSDERGSLTGDVDSLSSLFIAQVPNAEDTIGQLAL